MTPPVPTEVLRASLGQVLFRTARLFNELAVLRVQRDREPRLRLAHTTLFPHLDAKGVRPTHIAKQLGVSKQAVGPLLNDLVEWGMIERFADPADGRAVLVRLTPHGGAAILDGLRVLRSVEALLRDELGEGEVEALHAGLAAAMDVLDRARAEVG